MRVITMNELMLKIKLSMHVKYYTDKRTYNFILKLSIVYTCTLPLKSKCI